MRLRSIRYKDGRAALHVLPTPRNDGDPNEPENWRGKLVAHAKGIADQGAPGSELSGFVVIGLFEDGSSSVGFRLPDWLPVSLAPAFIADLLRRDGLVQREAENVFNRMFEWVE